MSFNFAVPCISLLIFQFHAFLFTVVPCISVKLTVPCISVNLTVLYISRNFAVPCITVNFVAPCISVNLEFRAFLLTAVPCIFVLNLQFLPYISVLILQSRPCISVKFTVPSSSVKATYFINAVRKFTCC